MALKFPISILKTLWSRRPDGQWQISDVRGLELATGDTEEKTYFALRGDVQLMTNTPNAGLESILTMIGPAEFLMQQSIVPVVAWLEGEHAMRCIGTASVISCTGYLLTAAHVLMDPIEAGYGAVRVGDQVRMHDNLNFGVLIPFWTPSFGMTMQRALRFFPIEKAWNWGEWKQSPLFHEEDRWEHLSDVGGLQNTRNAQRWVTSAPKFVPEPIHAG